MWLFDPWEPIKKMRALPCFVRNLVLYNRLNRNRNFDFLFKEVWYSTYDTFADASAVPVHYFYQDIWAARIVHDCKVREHVDVGSRLDGFVAHIMTFCRVRYVDIRPLSIQLEGFKFHKGSVTQLPFEDDSISSLSCLHVIEHIGLGRYGDEVNPDGYLVAAQELSRVLQPQGTLLIGTPVGRERLCFDGHRIFDPQTIVDAFSGLRLVDFSLIDDEGKGIINDASFTVARTCNYGCGLFRFEKEPTRHS
jgi:SAM-dependent methyltransferase